MQNYLSTVDITQNVMRKKGKKTLSRRDMNEALKNLSELKKQKVFCHKFNCIIEIKIVSISDVL